MMGERNIYIQIIQKKRVIRFRRQGGGNVISSCRRTLILRLHVIISRSPHGDLDQEPALSKEVTELLLLHNQLRLDLTLQVSSEQPRIGTTQRSMSSGYHMLPSFYLVYLATVVRSMLLSCTYSNRSPQ